MFSIVLSPSLPLAPSTTGSLVFDRSLSCIVGFFSELWPPGATPPSVAAVSVFVGSPIPFFGAFETGEKGSSSFLIAVVVIVAVSVSFLPTAAAASTISSIEGFLLCSRWLLCRSLSLSLSRRLLLLDRSRRFFLRSSVSDARREERDRSLPRCSRWPLPASWVSAVPAGSFRFFLSRSVFSSPLRSFERRSRPPREDDGSRWWSFSRPDLFPPPCSRDRLDLVERRLVLLPWRS
mmetsp:Transcript_8453/g.17609  ORF Transcript_8453/g.17609 Transcript_8453/m.17609 type:complete len:235 (-) Transcript_8453:53-757(-)